MLVCSWICSVVTRCSVALMSGREGSVSAPSSSFLANNSSTDSAGRFAFRGGPAWLCTEWPGRFAGLPSCRCTSSPERCAYTNYLIHVAFILREKKQMSSERIPDEIRAIIMDYHWSHEMFLVRRRLHEEFYREYMFRTLRRFWHSMRYIFVDLW